MTHTRPKTRKQYARKVTPRSAHTRPNNQKDSPKGHSSNGAKMQEELWPPKPNELDTAAVTLCACFTLGTTSMPSISSIGSCTSVEQCESRRRMNCVGGCPQSANHEDKLSLIHI